MSEVYPDKTQMTVIGENQPYAKDDDHESVEPSMLVLGETRPYVEDAPLARKPVLRGMARVALNGPAEVVRRMHEINGKRENNDYTRFFSRNATDFSQYSNPEEMIWDLYYESDPEDSYAAHNVPYSHQDYQNTRNRRDHDEAAAIKSVLKEADSTLWLRGKEELEARYAELGGNAQAEVHRRFYEANKDTLHANALADAKAKGTDITTPAGVTVPPVKKRHINRFAPRSS